MAEVVKIADVCGGFGCLSEKTTPAFRRRLVEVARSIGVDPTDLAAIIAFESGGSFSSSQLNLWCAKNRGNDPNRCGTGLIQFMPPTSRLMSQRSGVPLDNRKLAAMTPTEQLDWVQFYFKGLHKPPYRGIGDLYLAVFYPAAKGKPMSHVIARKGSAVYTQNSGMDTAGKGYITVQDIVNKPQGVLRAAAKRPPVLVYMSNPVWPAVVGVGLGTVTAFAAGIVVKSLLTSRAKQRRRAR